MIFSRSSDNDSKLLEVVICSAASATIFDANFLGKRMTVFWFGVLNVLELAPS